MKFTRKNIKYSRRNKPIRCKYWYKHYETDFDVERDVNIIVLELQDEGYEIINIVIDYVKFEINNCTYAYSVTVLYR